MVRRTGLVTTNRHVVEGADDYRIDVLDDANELPVPRYRASLIGYSMEPDFALLQIDRSLRGQPLAADRLDLPSVSLAAESPRRGDYVALFGYPGIADGYLLFTEGVVTTIRNGTLNDRRLPEWYQTDAEIAPGNSGGLAVNASGEMVGIPTRVTAERRTGGPPRGILALNAIAAVLDAGLETDMSRIVDSTNIPGIAEETLKLRDLPTFGTIALSAGFTPDPHAVWMVNSGTIAADYLGRSCRGIRCCRTRSSPGMERGIVRAPHLLRPGRRPRYDTHHQPPRRLLDLATTTRTGPSIRWSRSETRLGGHMAFG